MVFVIHWHESAMDLHVVPIPMPPPTSLSTRSLWVFPVHQARALVSCIQPGLVICFTLDNIHEKLQINFKVYNILKYKVTEVETWRANKHIKRHSSSLVITEIWTTTTAMHQSWLLKTTVLYLNTKSWIDLATEQQLSKWNQNLLEKWVPRKIKDNPGEF